MEASYLEIFLERKDELSMLCSFWSFSRLMEYCSGDWTIGIIDSDRRCYMYIRLYHESITPAENQSIIWKSLKGVKSHWDNCYCEDIAVGSSCRLTACRLRAMLANYPIQCQRGNLAVSKC